MKASESVHEVISDWETADCRLIIKPAAYHNGSDPRVSARALLPFDCS